MKPDGIAMTQLGVKNISRLPGVSVTSRAGSGFISRGKGQQFEYTHDDIGNRTQTKAGGDSAGANLRTATYTPNSLNQYSSRTVPNAVDILGTADAAATVTVNNQATYRKGTYYHKAPTLDNSAKAIFPVIKVSTVYGGNSSNVYGKMFLPKTPESYTYDLDGNLTSDGRWNYTWDLAREIGRRRGAVPKEAPRGPLARPFRESVISRAEENRLVRMESRANGPCGSKRRLEFEYDWQGRRIRKTVSDLESGEVLLDNTFLYDGWNLVAEINSTNHALVRSYLWGLDLSGTPQGAGGVGGLLAVNDPAHGAHFVAYDGNGNVVALVSARDGTLSAQYEYGPFGEPIRVSGPIGEANTFRSSTQYTDQEADQACYLRRYYSYSMGRWLSRDPIGEMAS
ncbi:MAG: hypothetical protein M1608_13875, partial [Candidatus Omnitrophica bacterium]|nr:hypothetical protein [Candidatus Omnitrophota bacterium]